MNILYTLTAYPPSTGGAQIHTHQLAQRMSEEHAVSVICQWSHNRTDWLLGTTLRAPGEPHSYVMDGIPVRQIGISQGEKIKLAPWVLAYPVFQGAAIERISETILKEMISAAPEFDLAHNIRIGREGISAATYKLAQQRNAPFVMTPVHHPAWSGWFHRFYHDLYRNADALIALTEAEKRTLVGLGVSETKIHVTGIGPILSEEYDPRRFVEKHGLKQAPAVLFLGQKYAYKGIASLLDATEKVWKKYPETQFWFIGPRTDFSRKLFQQVADPRILELDSVPLQEKTDALAACTLLCVPSAQESFGGVYTEAWSLGKPVIGCPIPAVSEVVNAGENGLLAEQNGETIAKAILQLLDDPHGAEKMGQRGKMKVETNFTWEQIARKTYQVYESLMK
ncbi:MAG: glycosyltransferase family 4 protein [Chloroflexi bacterium]|nr:glycosyltransferase family 4 protein [Chloroflexota bacterium]